MTTRELIERAREALNLSVEAIAWHASNGYDNQPTDFPRKRDSKALLHAKSALAALDAHLSEPQQSGMRPMEPGQFGEVGAGPAISGGLDWDGGINERTEFEAAMILKGALPITATAGFFDGIGEFWFERDEKGRYKFSRMQDVWEGWQARAKVAAPSAQPKETP